MKKQGPKAKEKSKEKEEKGERGHGLGKNFGGVLNLYKSTRIGTRDEKIKNVGPRGGGGGSSSDKK